MLRDLFHDLRFRLRAVLGRAGLERDLDDELSFHIHTEAERLIQQGVPAEEAARRARLAFGPVDQVKEASRDSRGVRTAELLGRDLSHAVRLAARRPGFTAVVALSLALGIGTTTAVFNLSWNLLFVPLAVPHPEQLVSLGRLDADGPDNSFTWAEYQALRNAPGAGALVTLRSASAVSVVAGDQRELINLHFVSGGYFPMIGVQPLHGRLITEADDSARAPVVLLSAWFAARIFPGDSAVVGRTVLIRDIPFTVVGVMPRSFHGLEFPGWFTAAIPEGATQLLSAYGPGRDNRGELYGAGDARLTDRRAFRIVGRLPPAATNPRSALELALQRCCNPIGRRQSLEVVGIRRGIEGGKEDLRPQARTVMAILLGAMVLVLVVVCCNVASLLLVRAAARQREIAVRLSLGASRSRLVLQLVLESAPAALLGALGSLVAGAACTALLVRSLPDGMVPAGDVADMLRFQLGPMLGFTLAVTLACTLAFAIYPALRVTRQSLAQALRLDARASRNQRQISVAGAVVVAQVAVTLMLVTAAALFTATLGNLTRMDGGFATDRVLLANLEARSTRYERGGVGPLADEILRRVQSAPGVRAAAFSTSVPLFGGNTWFVTIHPPGAVPPGEHPEARFVAAMPGYLGAAGIRVLAGRELTAADRAGSEPVAVVSEDLARKYFPDSRPLDRSLGVELRGDTVTMVRIVGVAADVTYDDLRDPPEPFIYFPMVQAPGPWHNAELLVRTSGPPTLAGAAVRRAIEAAAPGLGVRRMNDMVSVREQTTGLVRLAERLAAFVSAMALLLSAVGLYGVVAYSVSRRTSEIGVRLALGARTRAVLWLVTRETVTLVAVGVAVGIPLSFAANGALRSQLFGVSPRDPLVASVAVLLLALAGLAASVVPALRATRIDPRSALNAD